MLENIKCSQCKKEVEETFAVKITDIHDDEYEVEMCDSCIKNLLNNVKEDTEIYADSTIKF